MEPALPEPAPPPLVELRRPLGLRLIIIYKLIKAPLMLGLAVALTVAPVRALAVASWFAQAVAEHLAFWRSLGRWLGLHLTPTVLRGARLIAWLDAGVTIIEAVLLLLGKAWGEWMVVGGLAVLLPFEARALVLHRRVGRLVVLLVNLAVVGYLVRRQVLRHRRHARAAKGA